MSQEHKDIGISRVTVTTSPKFSVETNFTLGNRSDSKDEITLKLLRLSSDWSAYCISAMSHFVRLTGAHTQLLHDRLEKQLVEELREVSAGWSEGAPDEGRAWTFVIHDDEIGQVSDLLNETSGMARAVVALQRATISALLAELDFFLARLLDIIKDQFPEELVDSKERYALGEIEAAGGVEEFRIHLLAKKLDEKLRGSHAGVFEWIVEKMKLANSRKILSDNTFLDFVEVCQRRHILTHNGGIVNRKYIDECVRAGIPEEKIEYKIGERVQVTPKYLKRSIGRVYLTGYYIVQMIIQKRDTESKSDSLRQILNTAHAFLRAGHTKMCARLCDFALQNRKAMDRDLELRFAINRALAELYDPVKSAQQQIADAEKILSQYDWTVIDEIFRLAYCCVRRDFSNLIPMAKAAATAGLTYGEVQNFAVFKEARKQDGFVDCFPRLKHGLVFDPLAPSIS